MEPMSFVKAVKAFFETEPHGRKVEIAEFKALSWEDKVELRDQLIAQGFDVIEMTKPAVQVAE